MLLTITFDPCPYYTVFSVRWGNTPLDDAMQFGHDVVVSVLQEYQRVYNDSDSPYDTEEANTTLETLESIV